ncbi:MAG: hypothetical protein ACXU60_06835 [Croceibacterium sp.]
MSRPIEETQAFSSLVFVRSPLHDQQVAIPPENQPAERLGSHLASPGKIVCHAQSAHDAIAGIEVDCARYSVDYCPVEA